MYDIFVSVNVRRVLNTSTLFDAKYHLSVNGNERTFVFV